MSPVDFLGGRLRRLERISLAIALVWGTGLVIAALLVPVYQSSSGSSSGTVTSGSATLVGVNGWGALLAAGAPLAAALMTGWVLWRRVQRPGAGILAWTVTGLIICFNLLPMPSIGLLVLPVPLALVVACAAHGRRPHDVVTHTGIAS